MLFNNIKNILIIIKPGIVIGNMVVLLGNLGLATHNNIYYLYEYNNLNVILGMLFIISSACTFNNFIDKDIDKLMLRTKNRPSVTKAISEKYILILASILAILGFIFMIQVNLLSFIISLFGLFLYVIPYSFYYKRKNIINSLIIGAVAGSIPALIGFTSIINTINIESILAFIIMFFWQISHYLAITIYRREDFNNAKIPILSINKSVKIIVICNFCFVIFSFILANIINMSYLYFILIALINFTWFIFNFFGFFIKNINSWSKKSFILSIFSITTVNLLNLL